MMVLAAFLMAVQAAVRSVPVAPPGAPASAPPLPADWATLPVLRWTSPPRYDADMTRFVIAETQAGRCAVARGERGSTLKVDLAVLVTDAGEVRGIVPRAIGCPTVEQYTSGIISRMARDNVAAGQGSGGGSGGGWYRTAISFSWTG